MDRLLIRIYLKQRGHGVLLLKTNRYTLRINHIEKPDQLKIKLKELADDMAGMANMQGCIPMDGKTALAGVILYKLRTGEVTLRLMGQEFCWKGTLIEFKRTTRLL
uniref:hypothetical protein n=1 Tax=Pedobacter schmidteae TaxID=2201271 RepID=UPI000EB0EB1C|nr:hypothetical protein [Pedobacter schmidteae]